MERISKQGYYHVDTAPAQHFSIRGVVLIKSSPIVTWTTSGFLCIGYTWIIYFHLLCRVRVLASQLPHTEVKLTLLPRNHRQKKTSALQHFINPPLNWSNGRWIDVVKFPCSSVKVWSSKYQSLVFTENQFACRMLRRVLGSRGQQRPALGRPRPWLFLFTSNNLTRFSLPRLRPVLTPWNCVWSRQFSKHSPGNWVKIQHESIAVSSYKVSRAGTGVQAR